MNYYRYARRPHSTYLLGEALLSLAFGLLLFNTAAAEGTGQQLELEVDSSLSLVYDPFSGLSSSEAFQIRLVPTRGDSEQAPGESEQPASSSKLLIRIKPSNGGSFVASTKLEQLPVFLEGAKANQVKLINNEYHQTVRIAGELSEKRVFDYRLKVPESLFASPGIYQLELDVELIDAATQLQIGSTESLAVGLRVEPKLQTNIAGTTGRYEEGVNVAIMDFGILETGESKQVYIQVRGNTQANIAISSENRGKMIHRGKPNLSVDYSVAVDGVSSSLAAPLNLSRKVARDLQGSAYPMRVTIGDVKASYAGVYQDIIHVDVSPQ